MPATFYEEVGVGEDVSDGDGEDKKDGVGEDVSDGDGKDDSDGVGEAAQSEQVSAVSAPLSQNPSKLQYGVAVGVGVGVELSHSPQNSVRHTTIQTGASSTAHTSRYSHSTTGISGGLARMSASNTPSGSQSLPPPYATLRVQPLH